MNVVKSVKGGNVRHDLVDTGMGWQVRIYNGDELYDTGLSKNSEQKGLAALEDTVAYTEKLTRTKRQGVAEGSSQKQQKELAYNQGMEDYDDPEVTIPNYKSWGQYAKYYIKGWKSAQELEAGSHRDELERNPERFDDEWRDYSAWEVE